MNEIDPRLFWIRNLVIALLRTHPNPAALKAEFNAISEKEIANFIAASRNEDWLASLLALRDGYEAMIPNDPPQIR